MTDLTYGQRRVRLDFNPNGNQKVNDVKLKFAALIDEMVYHGIPRKSELPDAPDSIEYNLRADEINRLIATTNTKLEDACMWAIKVLTA